MKNSIVDLACQFIRIQSIEHSPDALREALRVAVDDLQGFTVEMFEDHGIQSALIYAGEKRPERFRVLLNAHLDVVPGKKEGYSPSIDGDKLSGVGALDMKASVACLIHIFRDMAKQVSYPLGLQLVTDEEVGGFHGTKWQIEQGVRADFVICGEPTNFDIVNKAKGILWVDVVICGVTAHGAYPWRGKNAILLTQDFLGRLMYRFPIPQEESWVTTVNVAKMSTSNSAYNKIPDECSVSLDIRFVPEDKDRVLKFLHEILPKESTMHIVVHEPSLYTDEQNEILQSLKKSSERALGHSLVVRGANGSSDARHYMTVGCPGIEFGPIGGDIGGDTEWVSVSSLNKYYHMLCTFLQDIDK